MAKNMKMIPNINLVAFLADFTTYPYLENQNYFTEDGLVFQDIGGRRVTLAKIKVSNVENTTDDTLLKGNLVLVRDTSEVPTVYELKYIDENGSPFTIASGGGTNDAYVLKVTNNWKIENEGDNFVISQDNDDTSGTGTYAEIFKIHKGTSGLDPDSKVTINAKTTISELDFGGW